MNVPNDLRYTTEHEWVKLNGKQAVIGITDYAQHSLGDIVFVELPSEGDAIEKGKSFGVVESVKAVSELYAPVSGTVAKANTALLDNPELINADAYENWMIVVDIKEEAELGSLLDANGYEALLEQEK